MAVMLLGVVAWGGLYSLLGPRPLGIWDLPAAVTVVGWVVMIAGTLISVVSQIQMGASWRIGIDEQRTSLVTNGMFSLVRNPVFSGMLLTMAGLVLVTPSPWTVMGYITTLALLCIQVRLEESHLIQTHTDRYISPMQLK